MQRGCRGAVFVFARAPVPGRTKTRLAGTVGAAAAAELARAFLRDTLAGIPTHLQVAIATPDPLGDFGFDAPERVDHGGGDLGARIERVLRHGLERAPWAVALGGDSPGLPPERLTEAEAHLSSGRAVLGPSEDGGFYLLGLPRCPRGLLADLGWSQPDTGARTWERLVAADLDPVRLEPWFDIDTEADLERFRALVPTERAPHTWAGLAGMLRPSED